MATKRWLGVARAVAQIDTITISGGWATGNTITLTIGGAQVVVTIGSLTTTDQVATTLKQAFNGEALTDTTAVAAPSAAAGGARALGQFYDLTATVNASVVTITATTAGRPFTLTAVDTAAGAATQATATAATGPNHYSNAQNWSGSTLPATNDTLLFDSGNVDVKYGLATTINPAAYIQTKGYTGRIGLDDINTDTPSLPYQEYRGESLAFTDAATAMTVRIGEGFGAGSPFTRLDFGAIDVTVNVTGTGNRAANGPPPLLMKGTAFKLNALGGDMGVAYFDDDAATVTAFRVASSSGGASARVTFGPGVTFTSLAGRLEAGAEVTIRSGTTGGLITVVGGVLHLERSSAHESLVIRSGGRVNYRSDGALETCEVGTGGIFTRDGDMRAFTLNDQVLLHAGSTFLDPHGVGTYNNGFKLVQCRIQDVKLDLGANRVYTVA